MRTTLGKRNDHASTPKPKRDLRAMRRAAMAGDQSAAKALLRLYHFDELAREIKPGKPYSIRVRNAVNALTTGTDSEWEVVEADGSITNLLQIDPPPRRRNVAITVFDD
jgi:hypothetical protein